MNTNNENTAEIVNGDEFDQDSNANLGEGQNKTVGNEVENKPQNRGQNSQSNNSQRNNKPRATLDKNIKNASVGGLSLSERAERTREVIMNEQKIRTIIPLLPGEPKDSVKVVNINGWRMEIKKGVHVDLPITVLHIIEESSRAASEATSSQATNLANQKDDVLEALTPKS